MLELQVGPGALAEKTLPLIRGDMAQMLKGKGYQHHEVRHYGGRELQAEHISHRCVLEESQEGRIRSIVDLPPIFEELNNMGIHTAVCTSDSRSPNASPNTVSRRATDKQLQILGVADYAAVVMCGNDPGVKPKPDPYCALSICKQLGIEPHVRLPRESTLQEAIMVGDTATDLKMGRAAGLRASVAVLSGIGNRDTLKLWADHYIDDVSHLTQLILDQWSEDTKRG